MTVTVELATVQVHNCHHFRNCTAIAVRSYWVNNNSASDENTVLVTVVRVTAACCSVVNVSTSSLVGGITSRRIYRARTGRKHADRWYPTAGRR